MADVDVSQGAGTAAMLPGFRLEPAAVSGDSCWFKGCAEGGGESLLLRRIDGIPFAVAVRDLAAVVGLFGSRSVVHSAPLAIAVTQQGRIVAGSAAATSSFQFTIDPAAARDVAADAVVDVWAIYRDEGLEVLAAVAPSPHAAAERLVAVAAAIDRLEGGHGAIDSPSLRLGPAGPLVLAVGLSSLEAARRERFDSAGAWRAIAPERCLPPGHSSSAADQYALAVLWATARTGRPPHGGDTAEALVRSKLSAPPQLDGLEADERDVVARALSNAVEDRFESCEDFAAALCSALKAETGIAAASSRIVSGPEAAGDPPISSASAADTRPGFADSTASLSPVETGPVPDEPESDEPEQLVIPNEPDPSQSIAATIDMPMVEPASAGITPRLAAAPYKPGDLILPGYRLERRLGKGGFGEVWKASAPGGMSVAIKVISSLGRREGVREFRALRTVKDVRHAHIVPIFGVWLKAGDGRLLEEDEAGRASEQILQGQLKAGGGTIGTGSERSLDSLELIVAMGLGDRTLYDALQDKDPDAAPGIEPDQLLEWMRQAALAIDHFNRGGLREGTTADAVQHCDIKPQNMLLVGNVVQVCDFGLARVQGQARATANNLLSIAYAAPEMMVKPFNPSPSTDQYSLAVSYYELRTGRLPYGDQPESSSDEISAVELMRAKTDGKVELGFVPPLERRVLIRALSLDPADRFGSCEELVDMLESAIETDRNPQRPPAPFPWLKAIGLASGGVLATALLAWVLLRPQTKPPVEFLSQAKAVLEEAVTSEGVNREKVERAVDLADQATNAGEDMDGCKDIKASAQAVLRSLSAISAIRHDGGDIEGLGAAEAAVGELPAAVPESLRVVLESELVRRKEGVESGLAEEFSTALEAAFRDGGSPESRHLDAGAATAKRLARLDGERGERLAEAVEAIREISQVIAASQSEPAGLDAAVANLHRVSATVPQSVRLHLEQELSRRIVARAGARLNDNDLRSPEARAEGKRRALEDSLIDLERAIALDPHSWRAQDRRGLCESLLGRYPAALEAYGKALELLAVRGDSAEDARNELLRRRAYALANAGRYAESAEDYVAAAGVDPQVGRHLWDLKERAWQAGIYADAALILDHLQRLTVDKPDLLTETVDPFEVATDRAWLLACGFGADPEGQAVPAAKRLLEKVEADLNLTTDQQKQRMLSIRRANTLDTLAAAYARANLFDEAIRTVDAAIDVAASIDERLVAEMRRHRRRFEQKQPWGEP